MRPTMVISILLVTGSMLTWHEAVAADAALSLVINPRTGAASIRNDTGASLNIDGYLLTSTSNAFNPSGWSSFTGNGVPNWQLGPAAANRLGEANLFTSRQVSSASPISLGSPYLPFSPIQIGQLEPALTFEYHVAGGDSFAGDVVFTPQNNLTLLVDPTTGNASLQNQSNFDVSIDGLLITSPSGVLDPIGWNGLAESGTTGWAGGAAAANRLAEANLAGSKLMAKNGVPMSIGKPINASMIDDEADLVFEYHVAGGGSITGGVAFVAATAQPLVGDYNGNGKVDAADYTIWRNTLGSTTDLRANGDNTGASTNKIDQADYRAWKMNFGAGGGAGSGDLMVTSLALPEPSCSIFVIAVGIAVVGVVRIRRKPS